MRLARPRYCGLLLVAAAWALTAGGADTRAQIRKKREPPVRPFTLLLPAELAWTTTLTGTPIAAAVLVAGRVIVPLESGELSAIDASTGEPSWTEPYRATTPPVSSGSLVVAASHASIDAFDAATGEGRWRHALDVEAIALAATTETVYVQTALAITALASATGRVAWVHTVAGGTTIAPGKGGLAVTTSAGDVRLLATADGQPRWIRTLEGRLTRPAWSGDTVVVGSSADRAWGLDERNGSIKWKWPLGGTVGGVAGDPTYAYVATLDNLLRALNRGNGHQRWQHDLGTRAQHPPVALDGAVLVSGLSPALALFDSRNGSVLGTFEDASKGKPFGSPLVDPALRPGGISLLLLMRDGRIIGLRSSGLSVRELPPTPILALPGRSMPRERLPTSAR